MGKLPRIGDAERDEAVAVLWKHYEAGRLGPAEHEKRCTQASVARTRREIEALFADLPAPHPDLGAAVPPCAAGGKSPLSHVLEGVAVLVLLLGVVVLTVFISEDDVEWWMVLLLPSVVIAIFWLADLVRSRQGSR
jgi:hypothetical protein